MIATEPRSRRAAALPPEERRAAIVAATLPLMVEHGAAVTTRMIATAAGIAEGTIFRVFPDKEALIDAVIDAAFDPAPTEQALAAIDIDQPIERRLLAAVDIVQRRSAHIWRVTSAVGHRKPEEHRLTELVGLVHLFEPEQDDLRYEPAAAARMLRALTLALTHPALIGDEPLEPVEIVTLLLDGLRRR